MGETRPDQTKPQREEEGQEQDWARGKYQQRCFRQQRRSNEKTVEYCSQSDKRDDRSVNATYACGFETMYHSLKT